jgi:hypothetical protein
MCNGHVHTPTVTNPPSINALDPATGQTVAAAREYLDRTPPAATPPVVVSTRWHAGAGTTGYRKGKFFKGGTEAIVTIRRTQTEQQINNVWTVIGAAVWEKDAKPAVALPSYILWTAPVTRKCNLGQEAGVTVEQGFTPVSGN